ncbi:MAG TPA: amidohydrolase family protein, partial [Acidimicrobiia bacterium]|nr:amidohydrolase family protein [Acidimicrobiia bacterium]
DLVIDEVLPAAASLADFCDVFVEEGVFAVEEARRILHRGGELGLGARIHAEQLGHSGGARLAVELGAVSADHLDHVTEDDARALAQSGVAAVLAPGASYTLRSPQAPGPMLLEAGCTVALATDCNPGTSHFESMGPILSLATVQMGLTSDQALTAATLGGARSLGLDDRGFIAAGAMADLVVLDAPSATHLAYRPGADLVHRVFKRGAPVV